MNLTFYFLLFEDLIPIKFRDMTPYLKMDLKILEKIQTECSKKVIKRDTFTKVSTIGGIDVTYEKENPIKAWACIVIINFPGLEILYKEVVEDIVNFPYIPTFLAFRELPIMIKVYNKIKLKPDILFIDGQGISHPRGCGIATHFGIITNTVTVGVAKKKLLGDCNTYLGEKRGSFCYLVYNKKIIGAALRTKDNTKPIFISIGHKISLKTAIKFVLETSIYRFPEPLRIAHNFLQKIRKTDIN